MRGGGKRGGTEAEGRKNRQGEIEEEEKGKEEEDKDHNDVKGAACEERRER